MCTYKCEDESEDNMAGSSAAQSTAATKRGNEGKAKLVRGGTCHLVKGGWRITDYLTFDW